MSRKRRRPRLDLDALDLDALAAISLPGAFVQIGGERLPSVLPFDEGQDHLTFDAAVCAAGLRAFVRPRLASDFTGVLARHAEGANAVLVTEYARGARSRIPLTVALLDPTRN